MHRSRIAGFTLIELLIVIVIIGILAAIAIPSFNSTRGRAFAASMRTDLRNLATAEEAYFFENNSYTSDESRLQFTRSPGVSITFGPTSDIGWSATATHPSAHPGTCAMFVGGVPAISPATVEGKITCQ
jgi:prepilin-type N-terminal cleavage/methylation domain-containing protein